jgi:hypothetical protein
MPFCSTSSFQRISQDCPRSLMLPCWYLRRAMVPTFHGVDDSEGDSTPNGLFKTSPDSDACTQQSHGRVTALIGLPLRSPQGLHLILDSIRSPYSARGQKCRRPLLERTRVRKRVVRLLVRLRTDIDLGAQTLHTIPVVTTPAPVARKGVRPLFFDLLPTVSRTHATAESASRALSLCCAKRIPTRRQW